MSMGLLLLQFCQTEPDHASVCEVQLTGKLEHEWLCGSEAAGLMVSILVRSRPRETKMAIASLLSGRIVSPRHLSFHVQVAS